MKRVASNTRSMPNISAESPEMRVVKTLIAGLREAERDRLLLWLAARYDVRGRERLNEPP